MQTNLNQLRAFFLAAREKNLTRAAETLCITQPAVTMQIRSMEHNLGMKLIRRCGKDFQLTEAGDVLYGYAERIFGIVGEMEYSLKSYRELAQGSLKLGTTHSFARYFMPDLISRFQELFPKVKVLLKEGNSQEIAEGVLSFRYDLGLIGRLPYDKKLKAIPYIKPEFWLVSPPGHRFANKKEISLQDLHNEPIIIQEKGSGARYAILSLLRSHGVTPSVLVEAGSVEFIKEYVMQGEGISFLYKAEVEREVKGGLLVVLKIKEGPILLQTDIVFPRDIELGPPAQAFLRLMEEIS
jgi:DNA-binding transcriptional LysR family regulator